MSSGAKLRLVMPNGRMVFPRISHKDLTEDSSWTLALRARIGGGDSADVGHAERDDVDGFAHP